MALEALATIGFVSNIVQLVQFCCCVFFGARDVHNSGSLIPRNVDDLRTMAKQLDQLSCKLTAQTDQTSQLADLSSRCRKIAQELIKAIRDVELKITGGISETNKPRFSKWKSLRAALKMTLSRDTVQEIQSKLEQLREEMMVMMLSNTSDCQYSILDQLNSFQVENASNHFKLTEKIQQQADILSTLQRTLSVSCDDPSWSRLIQYMNEAASKASEISKSHTIMKSLLFESINVRHAAIVEAHAMTFEWIFRATELPDTDPRSNIALATWLRQGQGIFWITGKPGSGKSTLMKYLDDHTETNLAIQEWACVTNQKLVKASFYFWNSGTGMQKSIKGLLQSLLYHILRASPDFCAVIYQHECLQHHSVQHHADQNDVSWTTGELRLALSTLWNLPSKYFLHIDGLDEFQGDHHELIEILQTIAKNPNIKLCVSSRPWNCFQDAFGSNNVLRLHELTQEDMVKFADDMVRSIVARTRVGFDENFHGHLISQISSRSQGVFLWTRLVVLSLREGLVNSDPHCLILKRLHSIPTNLEEFFTHIIGSIEDIYQEKTAVAFLVASSSDSPLRIIHYSFLEEDDPHFPWQIPFDKMSHDNLSSRTQQTIRRLNGRYKGLLEAHETGNIGFNHPLSSIYSPVDFFHRTLRDFLRTPTMQAKLFSQAPSGFNVHESICAVLVAADKFAPISDTGSFAEAMEYCQQRFYDMGKRLPQEFTIIDHAQSISMTLHDGWEGSMANIALHIGRGDYTIYVLRTQKLKIDTLETLLSHTLACSGGTTLKFSSYVSRTRAFRTCRAECSTRHPQPDIVKLLLSQGAFSTARKSGIRIWRWFLRNQILHKTMSREVQDIFESFVNHGADIVNHSHIWIEKLDQSVGEDDSPCLDDSFFLFKILLTHGLDPNLVPDPDEGEQRTLWEIMLVLMKKRLRSDRKCFNCLEKRLWEKRYNVDKCHSLREGRYRQLIELFLEHGADPWNQSLHALVQNQTFPFFDTATAERIRTTMERFKDAASFRRGPYYLHSSERTQKRHRQNDRWVSHNSERTKRRKEC